MTESVSSHKAADDFSHCIEQLRHMVERVDGEIPRDQFRRLLDKAVRLLETQQARLERGIAQLSTLTEVAEIVTSSLDLPEVLQRIVETTTRVLNAKASTLRLLEEDGELKLQATYNLSQEYLNKGPVTVHRSYIQLRALQGETVYVRDIEHDERSQYPREAAREGLRSMLCTALRVRGRAIGTMSIYTQEIREFSEDEVRLFEALASQAALAIEQARLHARELQARELERELEIAGQIQMNLIPKEPPWVPGLDIAARMVPYREVSGDFYDFVPLPEDNLGFVIADVSGKSVPGALLMAETRAVLRTQIEHEHRVCEVITSVNHFVAEDTRITEFITLFYGVINLHNHLLTYTNAGHVPPLLFRGDQVFPLEEGGIILGFQREAVYTEAQEQLYPGDLIVAVTDGVIESMNPKGDIFGQHRLEALIQQHRGASAESLVETVYRSVEAFTGGQLNDDFTILVIQITE